MHRKWRSQSWRAAHPQSLSHRFMDTLHWCLDPLRRAIGKFVLSEAPGCIELAARFKLSQRIEGDYCEFGVYTGRSFVRAYKAITSQEQRGSYLADCTTRFYAFDSFRGLPKSRGVDAVYPMFSAGGLSASQEEFVANLVKCRVRQSDVKIVSGWYSEVLSPEQAVNIGLSKVAIAMVDCDLYESTVPVLKFLTNLLVDGAVLIFDDWHLFRGHPDLGPQRAFYEWSASKSNLRFSPFVCVPGSFQKAFIVHHSLNGKISASEIKV